MCKLGRCQGHPQIDMAGGTGYEIVDQAGDEYESVAESGASVYLDPEPDPTLPAYPVLFTAPPMPAYPTLSTVPDPNATGPSSSSSSHQQPPPTP